MTFTAEGICEMFKGILMRDQILTHSTFRIYILVKEQCKRRKVGMYSEIRRLRLTQGQWQTKLVSELISDHLDCFLEQRIASSFLSGMEITAKILKLIAYVLTFVLVLFCGVIAKGENLNQIKF